MSVTKVVLFNLCGEMEFVVVIEEGQRVEQRDFARYHVYHFITSTRTA